MPGRPDPPPRRPKKNLPRSRLRAYQDSLQYTNHLLQDWSHPGHTIGCFVDLLTLIKRILEKIVHYGSQDYSQSGEYHANHYIRMYDDFIQQAWTRHHLIFSSAVYAPHNNLYSSQQMCLTCKL